ncbi:DUF5133 domain-containing protein [Streptomyces sp. Qhu-G9]|uniref:DUF5133 domain-containing protein n=1 Tax=Streptomyces sp. Qhu-G9 TaxID=3452799 RepID=UPI0022AC1B07|nr:DUF5133 domain-containing protein [Streptomyces aurantiacus]WAU81752.1 DUF5133 domain-containing protein [Streptomyces aurantiacus]
MLMPHPATLRKLVEEYEALIAREAENGAAKTNQRSQDLAYTLCVSTGTRDVRLALEKARRQLAAAQRPVAPMPVRHTGAGIVEVREAGEAVSR